MKQSSKLLGMAGAIAIASPYAACAATIITDYEFTATTDGPITEHSGTFTLAYDDVTETYELLDIGFSVEGFVYNLENAGVIFISNFDRFIVGGTVAAPDDQPNFLYPFANDFWIWEYQGRVRFGYSTPNSDSYFADTATLRGVTREVTGAVPEPATWAVMLLGFFGIGGMARRKKALQSSQVSYAF